MPKSRLVWLLFAVLFGTGCHRAKPAPLEIGMWYWNSPFQLGTSDLVSLRAMKVRTLYVREATFTTDGHRLSTEFHEHWVSPASGLNIVLVYNFDAGVSQHFRTLETATIIADVVAGIQETLKLVRGHGISPVGIQLDLDCPTSLLPKYALLVSGVRAQLNREPASTPLSVSATALQTWLGSDGYEALAESADYLAPQFYESQTGQNMDQIQPIADIGHLAARVDKAESFGHPFYAGLATYGHALLYDQGGRLASMYHGLKPSEALRHPALRAENSTPLSTDGRPAKRDSFAGECLLKMKAIQPDGSGHGNGDTIAYLIPTGEMLRQQVATVQAARAAHCKGIILYRFPSADDELSLPLQTDQAVLQGHHPEPALQVNVSKRASPWALIAGEASSPVTNYQVKISNAGAASTDIDKSGCVLVALFSAEGVESASPGDFDEAAIGFYSPDGAFAPCARAHANSVILRKYQLKPGRTARSGPITTGLHGAPLKNVLWEATYGGGFDHLHGIATLEAEPSKEKTH